MSRYMLIFLVEPVQPFIEQACKTRDLWAGSLLIAKLMEAAMQDIAKKNTPGTFVFPAQQKVETIPTIPNKYVALFEKREHAYNAANDSINNMKKCWKNSSDYIWRRSIEKVIHTHHAIKEAAKATWIHETDFYKLFSPYWAITLRKEQQLYKDWLAETEQLLADCKYAPNSKTHEERSKKVPISSNADTFSVQPTDRHEIQNFWKEFAALYVSHEISQNATNYLNMRDIIKQLALQAQVDSSEQPFPSTSSIAAASFIEGLLSSKVDAEILEQWWNVTYRDLTLLNPEAANAIPYLVQKAKSLGSKDQKWLLQRDGDLYFPSIFTAQQLEKNYSITDSSKTESLITEGKSVLQEILHVTDAKNVTRPIPYYAAVKMNSDRMSLLVSSVAQEEEHRAISNALSNFACKIVPWLIEKEYPGRLVYSCGDDALALAPLLRDKPKVDQSKHVLELAYKLQHRYQTLIQAALPLPQQEKRLQGVTASIGIVLAYRYIALPDVLQAVREAEYTAKRSYGRNALVVTMLPRSGQQIQVGCRWHYADLAEESQPIPLFSRFFTLFKEDILSPKCIYVLLKEASALVRLKKEIQEGEVKNILSRHIAYRQHRVLKRARKQKSRNNTQQVETEECDLKQLAFHLVDLADAMDRDAKDEQNQLALNLHTTTQRRYGLVETLGWLLVMAFLAQKDHN